LYSYLVPKPVPDSDWPRRVQVLEAALKLFGQYGFRKTSMDEVAHAAGISRPGLYFHYPDKAALYCAALEYHLDRVLTAATADLHDMAGPFPERLAAALDTWLGRYVGSALGRGIEELLESGGTRLAVLFGHYHQTFEDQLTAALDAAVPQAVFTSLDVSSRETARALINAARGLKDHASSRAQFVADISVTARLIDAALRHARPVPDPTIHRGKNA
jgi:AcrR family transcriptional regulator